MSERLKRIAEIHVQAFEFSKGFPDEQFKFLHGGALTDKELEITPEQLLADRDGRKVLYEAFKARHPKLYFRRRMLGSLQKIMEIQVGYGLVALPDEDEVERRINSFQD